MQQLNAKSVSFLSSGVYTGIASAVLVGIYGVSIMAVDTNGKAPHGAGLSGRIMEDEGRFYIEPNTSEGAMTLARVAELGCVTLFIGAGSCSANHERPE